MPLASIVGKAKSVIFSSDQSTSTETGNAQTMSVLKPVVYNEDDDDIDGTTSDVNVLVGTVGSMRLSTESIVFPTDDTISIYEVKKGDTLASVAKLFKVSKNTILWANDITATSALKPGTTLVILPITGIKLTIKKGDTVASLAKKYKADSDDIAKYNGIAKDADLTIGDQIIIPEGEIVTPATTKLAVKKLPTAPLGYFVKPMKSYVKTQGIHGHNGVDLSGPYGSSIVAVAAGRVIVAKSSGYNGGYGSMIVVAHPNGIQTLYAHLSQVSVSQGDNVQQGQVIGAEGNTGRSTGPHLHIEVRGAANPF